MDFESERVLKLIFPDGVPDNLRDNPELYTYLTKLGTYKVEQLKKEQTRLVEETKHIVEQTQDLAISNYKTFIYTAENSRSIFQEFQRAESQVDTLIGKLPDFSEKSEGFLQESEEINENRRLNSITLKKNSQLLEILEVPQLMERCIREGRYEEALELASYVQKLGHHQGHNAIVSSIVHAVESLWHTMLVQLVAQLRTDLPLPKCLQIISFLRRMQAFGQNEMKLKFLQARDAWLISTLKAIPKDDAHQHLTKTIEVTRTNLFNIFTQYRAIFPEDDGALDASVTALNPLQGVSCEGDRIFQAWLHKKIDNFLETLETDLQRGLHSYDMVLGQCMYFGLSFGRVRADFRALMAPIFVRVLRSSFETQISQVNTDFKREFDKYTLINKVILHTRIIMDTSTTLPTTESESLSPPDTLLDFHPLANLCNGYLNAFNELRLCAPLALANAVTHCLQESLEFVAQQILSFYRQEQQAFTDNERETFVKLCSCFAYDLIPYIQRCVQAIFPQHLLTSQLGINSLTLEQQKITFLQQAKVLEPLKHLLPQRVEVLLKKPVVPKLEAEIEVKTKTEVEAEAAKKEEVVAPTVEVEG